MKNTLTAQEALEKLGFIPAWSDIPRGLGPEISTTDGVISPGTVLVIIGTLSREEASRAWRSIGWEDMTREPKAMFFYKTVAE